MRNMMTEPRKSTSFVVNIAAVVMILAGIVSLFVHYYDKFYDGVLERETVQMKMAAKYIRTIVEQDIRHCLAVIDTGEETFHHHNIYSNEQIIHILGDIKRGGAGFNSVGYEICRARLYLMIALSYC